jgi:predicted phosphohydrolase
LNSNCPIFAVSVQVESGHKLISWFLIFLSTKVFGKSITSRLGSSKKNIFSAVNCPSPLTNKPEFLVISGDLSFNGERDSHLELVKLLDKIEDTKVLVIPGNHDTYSLNSFSCLNDEVIYTDSITSDEFKSIYKDYGYSNAYSYDLESLSYIHLVLI